MKQKKKPVKRPQTMLGAYLGGVHMDISSNREVIFEGSKGILEYNDHTIKLSAGRYVVAFHGRGLHIHTMNEKDIVIHGFLTSIEYIS